MLECLDQVVQLPRPGVIGTGENFLDLIEQDDQRLISPGFVGLGLPALPEGLLAGNLQGVSQRSQQTSLLIPAARSDQVTAGFQPRHQSRSQERRLAHARGSVQKQDRRAVLVRNLLVQLADLEPAAEEDFGVLGREPGQMSKRTFGQITLKKLRETEQGVAGGVGQAPALDQLITRSEFPRETVVVGRV